MLVVYIVSIIMLAKAIIIVITIQMYSLLGMHTNSSAYAQILYTRIYIASMQSSCIVSINHPGCASYSTIHIQCYIHYAEVVNQS